MTIDSNSEAIRRYHTAKGYFQSAIMVARSPERNNENRKLLTLLSLCMLCAFSIELYLKAYLLGSGFSSKAVRAYNHKISALYEDAKGVGLREATHKGLLIVPYLDNLVSLLAPGHEDFTFRYIQEGSSVPDMKWENCFSVLDALDDIVDAKVGASASKGLATGRHAKN